MWHRMWFILLVSAGCAVSCSGGDDDDKLKEAVLPQNTDSWTDRDNPSDSDSEENADSDSEVNSDPETDSDVPVDTDSSTCAPIVEITSFAPMSILKAEQCCDVEDNKKCMLLDAADGKLSCTATDVANCAPGRACSKHGLCECLDSCDCREGRCTSEGFCLPSGCNGHYECDCWGGCAWWTGDLTVTLADEAAAAGLQCCEGYELNGFYQTYYAPYCSQ